ncbi:hypothetical protein UFOVP833_46 [uncultured Caudovirales phage]|uniref:Uncharacterized protein n=1 Tax=uncultured Caudovirales phage TaxID=2100421 RepID=A0A6J5STG0_9CAUD|nr:hypothetical protein UFOVP833_46 [uncultured Caudovirales phage]CAB4218605.1 hypothetical protein UFOVP1603_42 [uncultured Caudovirales phage]
MVEKLISSSTMVGQYNLTPPTYADGDATVAQTDSSGKLLVAATKTPSGTQDVNLTQVAGSSVTAGAGAVAAGTMRITQASDSPEISALGAQADAAWASGSGSIIAILKGIYGRILAAGAAAMAASWSVTIATDDARIGPVNETAPASDTASSGLNGRLQRLAQRITSLIALLPASLGSKAASASLSVVGGGLEYETVAASQTAQVLGATGATGDYLSHVIIQPVTLAAGTTTIIDNATTIFTFTTGTLSDLRPIVVPIGAFSVSGAWKITTGANVTAIGIGDFT